MNIKAGGSEAHYRDMIIRSTQQSIKHVLTERWYAWEDAWKVAEKDSEVDLTAEPGNSAYKPIMHEVPISCSEQSKKNLLTRFLRKRSRPMNLHEQHQLQVERRRTQS